MLGLAGALALAGIDGCSTGKGNSQLEGSGSGGGLGLAATGVGGFDAAAGTGSGAGDCGEASAAANEGVLPADIIFVVDNSGSMTDEAASVQASMNDFSSIIFNSGIDAHIIMLSADSSDDQGVCVPPPLGSGSCPADSNPANGYLHIPVDIGSSDALDKILQTYDQWKDWLRPGATKTIAIISDDNSGKSAAAFTSEIVALDPSFEGFKLSAVVAPYELDGFTCSFCAFNGSPCETCDPCCGKDSGLNLFCVALPADEGVVYKELVQSTGGVLGNLCTQDFLGVFQSIATAVVGSSQVPCVYVIPTPPEGETLDKNLVNVVYKLDPAAAATKLFNVPGGAPDCGADGGWYYDDPQAPKKIIFCDSTCGVVQSSTQATVDVRFGCATLVK